MQKDIWSKLQSANIICQSVELNEFIFYVNRERQSGQVESTEQFLQHVHTVNMNWNFYKFTIMYFVNFQDDIEFQELLLSSLQ